MSTPKTPRKLPLVEALAITALIAGLAFFKSSRDARLATAKIEEVQAVAAHAQSPNLSSTPIATPNQTLPSQQPRPTAAVPAADLPQRQGLCRYLAPDRFLHWRVVHLINKRNPKLIVLPNYHANCLGSVKKYGVADYDYANDVGFRYFGEFSVDLTPGQSYPSIDIFLEANQSNIKNFGFDDSKKLIKWLEEMGLQTGALKVFSVGGDKHFSIREPIGSLSKYPGLKIISYDEANSLINKDSSIQVMDLRVLNEKTKLPWQRAIRMSPENPYSIVTVTEASRDWLKLKEKTKLDFKSTFFISGSSENDLNPFSYGAALVALGASDVRIIKEGARGDGASLELPKNTPAVSSISIDQFLQQIKYSTLVDTREKHEGFKFVPSVRIPVLKQTFNVDGESLESARQEVISGNLNPDYSILNKPHFQQHVALIKTKDVIVMGHDDFDWDPLFVAENLKNTKRNFSLSWFRSGFTALRIYQLVGLISDNISHEIKKDKNVVRKAVYFSDPKTNLPRKVIVAHPKLAGPQGINSTNARKPLASPTLSKQE